MVVKRRIFCWRWGIFSSKLSKNAWNWISLAAVPMGTKTKSQSMKFNWWANIFIIFLDVLIWHRTFQVAIQTILTNRREVMNATFFKPWGVLEYIPRDTCLTSMTPSPKFGTLRMSVDMFNEGSTLLMKWLVFSILQSSSSTMSSQLWFHYSFLTFSGDSLLPFLFHLAFRRTSISDGSHSNMAADIFFMVPYKG
jgi:hypothetical protein